MLCVSHPPVGALKNQYLIIYGFCVKLPRILTSLLSFSFSDLVEWRVEVKKDKNKLAPNQRFVCFHQASFFLGHFLHIVKTDVGILSRFGTKLAHLGSLKNSKNNFG